MEKRTLLPIGVDNFATLIRYKNYQRHQYLFVDKTMLIKTFLGSSNIISLITRPRRFGKSLNMSMLAHFFAEEMIGIPTKGLFDHLKINQHPEAMKHQGRYAVVSLTLKSVKGNHYNLFYARLCDEITTLFRQCKKRIFEHTLEKDEKQLYMSIVNGNAPQVVYEKALFFLCELMYKTTHRKTILLLDEYDTPIHDAYVHGYYNKCISFMANLFNKTFKGNDYLAKAMITGILKTGQASLFSNLNNIKTYSLLNDNQYGGYFGFTKEETDHLLKSAGLPPLAHQLKEVYNGYEIGGHTLYNPFSIVNFAEEALLKPDDLENAIRPYWVNTGGTHLITDLLRNNLLDVEEDLTKLLARETIETLIDEQVKFTPLLKNNAIAFWSIILLAGYLKPVGKKEHDELYAKYTVCFPNEEIGKTFRRIALEVSAINLMYAIDLVKACNQLVQGNVAPFVNYIKHYLSIVASAHDTKGKYKEQFFHGFLLGLAACLTDAYHIRSNRESGKGRYDIALMPQNTRLLGIIIELKIPKGKETLAQAAQRAKQQIINKQYYNDMKAFGLKNILCIGIGFSGSDLVAAVEK